jgi:hypothetical protein
MTSFATPEPIADTVRMDAALARLLNLPPGSPSGSRGSETPVERTWGWVAGQLVTPGLEITEHTLPDGVDFFSFQTLLGALH